MNHEDKQRMAEAFWTAVICTVAISLVIFSIGWWIHQSESPKHVPDKVYESGYVPGNPDQDPADGIYD